MPGRRAPGRWPHSGGDDILSFWPPLAGGEEDDGDGEELVKLATVDSEPLAEMFAEMLRNEGITCVVKGAGAYSSALPFEINDHYLLVPAADLERAGELLGEYSDAKGAMNLQAPEALAARYGRRRRAQESRGSRWR